MNLSLAKIGTKVGKNLMQCKPIAKVAMKVNKNKPEILAVSGGVLVLAAFGWAIYEAVNVKDVMEESTAKVNDIQAEFDARPEEEKVVLAKEHGKKIKLAKAEGVWKVSRRFVGPAVTLLVGMGLSTKGFRVLRARNVVLGGALKSTEEAYKFYRENVRQDLGREADLKYAHGVVGEKEIEEKSVDDNGNEIIKKTKVPVVKDGLPIKGNPWRFEFSENWFGSWQDDVERNITLLKISQEWWNHELERYGDVSMYDVLKHLHFKFEVLKDGMTKDQYREYIYFLRRYGWRKGSNGDGFIDFGIYRTINEPAIKRQSDVVWIEFNVDGPLDEI